MRRPERLDRQQDSGIMQPVAVKQLRTPLGAAAALLGEDASDAILGTVSVPPSALSTHGKVEPSEERGGQALGHLDGYLGRVGVL